MHADSAATVGVVVAVRRIGAASDGGGYAAEQPVSVGAVGDDLVVSVLLASLGSARHQPARGATGRHPGAQAAEADEVRTPSARANDLDFPFGLAIFDSTGRGKFAEPVASDRRRMHGLETTFLASSQKVPQSNLCSGVSFVPSRLIVFRRPLGTTPACLTHSIPSHSMSLVVTSTIGT